MKILAYQGISWISRAIRWQTRSKYSHIAVELNDGTVIEAWHIGGVAHNKDFRAVHTKGTHVDVFDIVPEFNKRQTKRFLLCQVGEKYDFGSIVRFITRRNEPHDKRWFCSELAMESLSSGGIDLLKRIPASHVSPGQLVTSPLLKFIETRVV